MTREEAYDKLQEYIEGNLSADECTELECWIGKDPDLALSLDLSKQMETVLRDQQWQAPSASFTQEVMDRAGIPAPRAEAAMEHVMERATTWAPLGTVILVALFYGKSILQRLLSLWNELGAWLETQIGLSIVKSDPILTLSAVTLLVAAVAFYFFLARRSRVSAQ
jgi:hypothetical protein